MGTVVPVAGPEWSRDCRATYCSWLGHISIESAGYLAGINRFDADQAGVLPHGASLSDPRHGLLLELDLDALKSAGEASDTVAGVGS